MESNFIVMMLSRKDCASKACTIRMPSSWFKNLKIKSFYDASVLWIYD